LLLAWSRNPAYHSEIAKTPQAQILLLFLFLHVYVNDTAKNKPQKIKQNCDLQRLKKRGQELGLFSVNPASSKQGCRQEQTYTIIR